MLRYDSKTDSFVTCAPPGPGEKIEILYGRLSQEDVNEGDSGSIINQRDFLFRYAKEHGFKNARFIADDGYSGTNFDRPGFREMMELVERGAVTTIVVKDHSRFGRNRLVVGELMERFSEDYNVRYIAVNDGIDSEKGFDDMVAIREWFNEFYPRDTSKKIRAVFKNKGESGQRLCTQVLYGYTGNKDAWHIDPEAAEVVKKIFALALSGLGPMQIAKRLTAEGHLNPTAHRLAHGGKSQNPPPAEPTKWDGSTIVNILEHREYTGCIVNFKGFKKSYKSKKRIENPPEKWKIFPNAHPAIIDEETFERVQELRKNRRRNTKSGRQGLFSGVVFCADCRAKLHFATCKSFERTQDNYRCSNYKSGMGNCSSHYIREVVLRDFVLAHLRKTLAYVRTHEADFVKAKLEQSAAEQKRQVARQRQELARAQRRIDELDKLFQRIYEDSVCGKLTEERFEKLAAGYEQEQANLKERVKELNAQLDEVQDKAAGVNKFIALVRRYTEVQELTSAIVNEFVERIDVHAPEKVNGHRQQEIDITYNFIGLFDPPESDEEDIPIVTICA